MIVVIDYGMGNLKSVVNGLKYLNIDCKISSDEKEIRESSKLILPGVGAFNKGMENLKASQLDKIIIEEARKGKPILGICLGMQLLFDKSYEIEETQGLSLINGEVVKFQCDAKIPHMGWNSLDFKKEDNILYGTEEESFVYFVHSYYAEMQNKEEMVATCTYGGIEVPAIVRRENIIGMQFHPEKSGDIGLNLLKNFKELI
ncbi:imidazole glycerol phosphate synthase subunit HisH [Inconstantimicrobium mannanitabidum]|uniref:Imidazole glycerol phosphate synthase subunit HisH n=1 Tax=Inconstantimicrobium mannanitabidum TaxID=1604901 RepID=A0ACB5RDW3_9CLOT|nr:imidazole glycerol phosphate synthase subunit HisH [Clostridium sp. TW13]GKX66946.1 imidazole glycerol phosphate synthase subunit HisH [Clostridium sp. TW13]